MRTTIDAAGRIVVPKAVRDAMGLSAGRVVDVVFTEGRIEIELAPADVSVESSDALPRLVPADELPELTDQQVRDALEATRR
ncbi:MAG: AbrB/MazE/SpoVT family DNA-binding domain-containing protein [Nocardioides sp.]|nr:AbrB/MazE/SpoVT family DNA-binding domain-containing protein [Nocardioides sp.]